MPLADLAETLRPTASRTDAAAAYESTKSGELTEVATMIAADLVARLQILIDLGLGYLTLSRRTPTVSPGELQRLRLATQLRAGLFGVLYVLDEPSAGLHPADAEPLLDVLDRLRRAGNSLFVVEHDMDVVRRADWIVDVGPGAGELGGDVLYSGPVPGLADIEGSVTRRYLFDGAGPPSRQPRTRPGRLRLRGICFHNLRDLDVDLPLGVYTAVTGVSGSGKSTLVVKVLGDVVNIHLGAGRAPSRPNPTDDEADTEIIDLDHDASVGVTAEGVEQINRLVSVDQRPIGRTPRSTLATYTGLFDAVRREFAATPKARRRGWTAGRFSFNVAEGRCPTCQGEGFVSVELLFLPGTYATCPACQGARYSEETLEVRYRDRTIADVLAMTVDEASEFLADVAAAARSLTTLQEVGLGYLRLGQPATELSGGEAQRIKLASELQRPRRGTPSTCSTSRPPGCIPPTSICSIVNCTASSTRATPSWWPNTTCGWWRAPTGSSTWDRAPVTTAVGSSRRARPRRWHVRNTAAPRRISRSGWRRLLLDEEVVVLDEPLAALLRICRRAALSLEVVLTHNLVANVGAVEHRVAGHRPSQHRSDLGLFAGLIAPERTNWSREGSSLRASLRCAGRGKEAHVVLVDVVTEAAAPDAAESSRHGVAALWRLSWGRCRTEQQASPMSGQRHRAWQRR